MFRENFDRGVVGDLAIFNYAAVAMIRIFAQANVGDDDEVQFRLANGFDGALYDAVLSQ